MEEDFRRITAFHHQLRAVCDPRPPSTDYQKCLKKINFTIFRRMLDEYESNIRPLLDSPVFQKLREDLTQVHGLELQTAPRSQYRQFSRKVGPWELEMRVFRFRERKVPVTGEEVRTRQMEERLAQQEKERDSPGGEEKQLFFKDQGRFLHTSLLPFFREQHVLEKESRRVYLMPFNLQEAESNIIEVAFVVGREGVAHRVHLTGTIMDLWGH